MKDGKRKTFLILAVVSALAYIGMLLTDNLGLHYYRYLALFLPPFLCYLGMIRLVRQGYAPGKWIITGIAVLLYLILLPTEPTLSDDVYRYLWEGKVQLAGHNPFVYAPDAMVLEPLRDGDAIWPRVTMRYIPAIYPPVAQFVFRLAAAVHYSILCYKTILLLFFAGSILFLYGTLEREGKNPSLAVIFAFNPLVIIETASSGHLDMIGIFFLLGAWYFFRKERTVPAAVFYGAAILSKFLPVLLLPFFLKRTYKRDGIFLAVMLGTIIAGYQPFIDGGTALFSALRTYSSGWVFNAPVFGPLSALGVPRSVYIAAVAVLLGAAVLWLRLKVDDAGKAVFVILALLLVLSPVVFPWYLQWLIPFAAYAPSLPLVLWTGLVQLSYQAMPAYLAHGIWKEGILFEMVEYVLLAAAAGWYYRGKISELFRRIRG